MDWLENGWGLSLIVFLPVICAVVLLAIPKAQEAALKWTALAFSLVTLAASVVLVANFDYSAADTYQFGTSIDTSWIEAIAGWLSDASVFASRANRWISGPTISPPRAGSRTSLGPSRSGSQPERTGTSTAAMA